MQRIIKALYKLAYKVLLLWGEKIDFLSFFCDGNKEKKTGGGIRNVGHARLLLLVLYSCSTT